MSFQSEKTYRLPTGDLVRLEGREMGWYQLGNESNTWTVAPDGKVYEGLLTEGLTHPYRATGPDTGWNVTQIAEV